METMDMEQEAQPMPTSFLEGSEPLELAQLEVEMDVDMVDQIGDIDDVAIDTDTLAINDVTAPVTNFLQEEELPQPTGFLDGVEGAQEIELSDESQIVETEVVEEIEVESPPAEPDFREELERLIQEQEVAQALSRFTEAIEKHGDDEKLISDYANLCYDFGLVDNTLESYRKLLTAAPGNNEIRRKMIRTQLVADKVDDAVLTLVELGNSLTGSDNVEEAQRVFQHVLALQDDNSRAREALSEIYLNLEMKQLALYHLNILAQYLEKQDSIDETIKVLKKIYSLTTDISTQEKLARVYISHDFHQEAIGELEKLASRYLELDTTPTRQPLITRTSYPWTRKTQKPTKN